MKKIILATLGMGLLAVGFNASAVTTQDTVNFTLGVTNTCSINSSGVNPAFADAGFGAITNSALTGGNLVVTCSGTNYLVAAGEGSNAANGTRNLSDGSGNTIAYSLTIGGTAWGDAGLSTGASTIVIDNAFSVTGSTGSSTHIIAGTANVLAASPVGNYTDNMTITVEF